MGRGFNFQGMRTNTYYNEHCMKTMARMADGMVNTVVTSPPYYLLRDYGHPDQIGLEGSMEEYIATMVDVFREVRRVLADDGTLWLNLGDSYSMSLKGKGDKHRPDRKWNKGNEKSGSLRQVRDLPAKNLLGIPWRVALALQADGWILRQDIIWHKPNPMPESVTDRCTKAHEYIFLFSKSPKYYYDHKAIMVDAQPESWKGSAFDKGKTATANNNGRTSGNATRKTAEHRGVYEGVNANVCGSVPWEGTKANRRSVWSVSSQPFKEAHFATFPEDLIAPCILAGCPEGGLVYDPFGGAFTTAVVAARAMRKWVVSEINPEYCKMGQKRLKEQGLTNMLFQ